MTELALRFDYSFCDFLGIISVRRMCYHERFYFYFFGCYINE